MKLINKTRYRKLIIGFIAFCFSCSPDSKTDTDDATFKNEGRWFQEVAIASGVNFEHVRAHPVRHWFPEIMSGGVAWLDYDHDGDLDLYVVQGGELDSNRPDRPGNRLFRNHGSGSFEDVTEEAGVGDKSYGMGCAIGDFDSDGDADIYVTNVGANVLYRNEGNGTFIDVTTQAGVGHSGWGTSASFADYDNDGSLDLYVVNYINWSPEREVECFAGGKKYKDYCHPDSYNASARDVLYHNNGNGTFTDISQTSGIFQARGNGLGITTGDFDGDGRIDFYVANDGNTNRLWINNGDGTFSDKALLSGSAANRYGLAEAGMGVVAIDIENDGDLDLFMTHLRHETNTLYINEKGVFDDVTTARGLSVPSIHFTGFGVGFADFDHDGQLDIYLVNGRVTLGSSILGKDPFSEPNQLFRGLADNRFEEVLPRGGTADPFIETSRAAAFGDYDGDGDVDIVIVNNGGQLRLLENTVGSHGNWIMFRALNQSGHDVIGATVQITIGLKRQRRLAQPSYSYLSSNDHRVHFGIANADSVDKVDVVWPDGQLESFGSFDAGAVHELRKGASIL